MRLSKLVLATLVFTSCHEPPATLPPVRGRAQRVVLLSVDGLAATRHQRLLSTQAYRDPDGLARFAGGGLAATAIPPNPTLTSVSHATIATGRLPQEHGIVGNRFHLPGTPLGATVSGFDHPWEAEPLWAAVHRRGGKVGVITFPGVDGTSAARRADFFMVYINRPAAPARMVELTTADLEGSALKVHVALEDGGKKETVTFSLRVVEDTGAPALEVGEGTEKRRVGVGEWFPLTVTRPHPDGGQKTLGSWCLLKALDLEPLRVVLYQGGFYALEAYPRTFRELVEREAGFWPGPPDDAALESGIAGKPGLSLAEYGQQLERFSRFFTAATLAAVRHMPFDLLLAYQPVVDEAQHALTLEDPRQPAYTPGLAATAQEFLDWTYLVADGAVGDLARALDLSRDALVVVSDHGISPVWAQVNLQTYLNQLGLCATTRQDQRMALAPDCTLWAVQGGGVAHLYANLATQEPTGLTTAGARHKLLLRATQALARLEAGGEPALEAVAPREQAEPWGLAHPGSGDLVVFPKLGVGLGGRLEDPLITAPPYAGMHGYLNHHPSMAAVFMARGAGVPQGPVASLPLTDVAPFVAKLLALPPPGQ